MENSPGVAAVERARRAGVCTACRAAVPGAPGKPTASGQRGGPRDDRHERDRGEGDQAGALVRRAVLARRVDEDAGDQHAADEAADVALPGDVADASKVIRKLIASRTTMPWTLTRTLSETTSIAPISPKIAPEAPTVGRELGAGPVDERPSRSGR